MIPYLDTSALLKLVVEEPDSDRVWALLASKLPFTCRISYAEARAGLARREREMHLEGGGWEVAKANLDAHWEQLRLLDVTDSVVRLAGDLADLFGLRGYDAVQLASARALAQTSPNPVHFVCFDRRLNRAAKFLGMPLLEDALI